MKALPATPASPPEGVTKLPCDVKEASDRHDVQSPLKVLLALRMGKFLRSGGQFHKGGECE